MTGGAHDLKIGPYKIDRFVATAVSMKKQRNSVKKTTEFRKKNIEFRVGKTSKRQENDDSAVRNRSSKMIRKTKIFFVEIRESNENYSQYFYESTIYSFFMNLFYINYLFLTEPTNMLDMKAIIWLEDYLQVGI